MFPEVLASELLSLGAGVDSFALSCGVILNEQGEVTSFEVCPSKVRVTKRLSYIQLDEILTRGAELKTPVAPGGAVLPVRGGTQPNSSRNREHSHDSNETSTNN
jgi:exoribonuclease R